MSIRPPKYEAELLTTEPLFLASSTEINIKYKQVFFYSRKGMYRSYVVVHEQQTHTHMNVHI